MTTLEVYFDCSSPWTYLGFSNIRKISERLNVPVRWRPIIVGGVFNKVNAGAYQSREQVMSSVPKLAYQIKDMHDWARYSDIVINFPPKCGHPVNAVKCMRACLFLEAEGKLLPFASAAFEALWHHGRNLGDEEVLADLARQVGAEPIRLIEAINSDEMRAAYIRAHKSSWIGAGLDHLPTSLMEPICILATIDCHWLS